ncbi:hypothetical protein KW787_02650 [Candidatus Pacearchaeota archaeon]|nr:hypothetical protein [Candidatus Pacearchaeota archaeon]
MKKTLLTMIALGSALALPTASSADMNYNNFDSVLGIVLNGIASQYEDKLRLTNGQFQSSSVWYDIPQAVDKGFTTTFQFQASGSGDGLAFVLQNESLSALGGEGAGLGYSGISNSLAIEFDFYPNLFGEQIWTADYPNEISLQTRGILPNHPASNYSLEHTVARQKINSGDINTVKIDYIPGSLQVFMNEMDYPMLMASVDLLTILDLPQKEAIVGFTGGTGESSSTQDILNWSFNSVPEPAFTSLLAAIPLVLRRRR